MQGIVTDEKGAYVKAAIVALFRETPASGESEEGAVTYDETDEKGRFLIQDLNPDDKYIIEVFVPKPEPVRKVVEVQEPEPAVEEEPEQVMVLTAKEPEQVMVPAEKESEPELIADEEYEQEPAVAAEPVWDNRTGSQDFFDILEELEFGEEDELLEDGFILNEADIIDSLTKKKPAGNPVSNSLSGRNLYDMSGIKDKQYMTKLNLW